MSYKDNYDDYKLFSVAGKFFWIAAARYWAAVDELAEIEQQLEAQRRQFPAIQALLDALRLGEDRELHPPVSRGTGQISESVPQRPRDLNMLAANIAQAATKEDLDQSDGKDPAAVELGRKGGLKGGKARSAKLSPKRRRDIARNAAAARWSQNA